MSKSEAFDYPLVLSDAMGRTMRVRVNNAWRDKGYDSQITLAGGGAITFLLTPEHMRDMHEWLTRRLATIEERER